jgi:hypothetical protein
MMPTAPKKYLARGKQVRSSLLNLATPSFAAQPSTLVPEGQDLKVLHRSQCVGVKQAGEYTDD